MLIHSEKAISLWKTVHLASVLSNTSHLRFWQLSAWLCAWFLILVKEKWKFKALQELLLMVECESSQGPGISWVPRTLILQPSRHAGCPGLWQTARLLKGQHSTLLLSCQARCLWAVQWQGDTEICGSQHWYKKPRDGRQHSWEGIWPLTLWTSIQHSVKVLNQWDDAQIPLGATLTMCGWMAEGHFSHSSFFSTDFALWNFPPTFSYLAAHFNLHCLLLLYSAAAKNWKWSHPTFFQLILKKKK